MKTKLKKAVPPSAQFERVESGIFRYIPSGVYYERPKINGRRTWRSLETANLKYAREELHRRRSGMVEREAQQAKKPKVTVGEIVRRYVQDGYPDRQKQPRQGRTLQCEKRNSTVLLKYWDAFTVDSISLQQLDRYHEWRKRNIGRGKGDRAVDMELNTLSNAMLWGMRCNLIQQHPLSFRRPRYCCAKSVKHCRDFMPHDTEAMHEIGTLLFADIRSETLGWQFIFEAFTGLRTCEALQLRTDAKPYEAGWISPDGKSVCVRRAKNQQSVNPLVRVHDGLAAWLKAHREWKQNRYPDSPWYFPSYRNPDTAHSDVGALGQALRRHEKTIGRKITSHGMRAFYVTVRRSHGIPDIQIAWEIGHTSAGKTLASVYGGVPPHWLMDDGPKLQWLPADGQPAWEAINSKPAKPPHPAQKNGVPAVCSHPASAACSEASPEPVRPATKSRAAESSPPTRKSSEPPPDVTTNNLLNSLPTPPFSYN